MSVVLIRCLIVWNWRNGHFQLQETGRSEWWRFTKSFLGVQKSFKTFCWGMDYLIFSWTLATLHIKSFFLNILSNRLSLTLLNPVSASLRKKANTLKVETFANADLQNWVSRGLIFANGLVDKFRGYKLSWTFKF